MKKLVLATAAAAFTGMAGMASAALLDFTDDDAYDVQQAGTASGMIGGAKWTLIPSDTPLTYTEPGPGPTGDLEGDNDGVGIKTDEISTNAVIEYITVEFTKPVEIKGVRFLDLFIAQNLESREDALLYEGAGIGDRFLGHIERCAILVHLIDATGEDPLDAYRVVRSELEAYGAGLGEKTEIVALNKTDAADPETLDQLAAELAGRTGEEVYRISGVSGDGVKALLARIWEAVEARRKAEAAAKEAEEAEARGETGWTP